MDAHFTIVDYFFDERDGAKAVGGVGPRDFNLLSSAVARQMVSYAGQEKWETDYEKLATLFFGLIKNHPFHDCNKRTAMLSALYYLLIIKRTPIVKQRELEKLALRVADNDLGQYKRYKQFEKKVEDSEIIFIADFFKRNSRVIDKNYYVITYHELVGRLNKFGYTLDNPHGNYIDVIRIEKKKRFFGLGEKYTKETKVGTIGFPGWTKEVSRVQMKKVQTFTKLTHRNGFDSEVFFRGADPLSYLVNEYRGLLKRLSVR